MGKWEVPEDETQYPLCRDHDRLGLSVSLPLCSRVEMTTEESSSNLRSKAPEPSPPSDPCSPGQSRQPWALLLPSKYPIAACLTELCGKRRPTKGSLRAVKKRSGKDTSCVVVPESFVNYWPPFLLIPHYWAPKASLVSESIGRWLQNKDLAVSNFYLNLNCVLLKIQRWMDSLCFGGVKTEARHTFRTILNCHLGIISQTIKCSG